MEELLQLRSVNLKDTGIIPCLEKISSPQVDLWNFLLRRETKHRCNLLETNTKLLHQKSKINVFVQLAPVQILTRIDPNATMYRYLRFFPFAYFYFFVFIHRRLHYQG